EGVHKVSLKAKVDRWDNIFAYIESRPELEDIVISGGDSYNLRAEQIRLIGERLLAIPHLRRMRFASKGPAVMPQKILTDDAWFSALAEVVERGRKLHKDIALHTHFNHPNEITEITERAMNRLMEAGIHVRNQSVLLRGVNDSVEAMGLLIKRMSYVHVHGYYVYQHDLVSGVEDLRTTVGTSIELEKQVRGMTAGYNSPLFIVDAPGGGGKRDVHSFEHYNPLTGVSVYRSPNVDADAFYCYFDPIDLLPAEGQARWAKASEHDAIVDEALSAARERQR
ncbi:MAG TPA: KamA family radical SAM protein, partial [Nannocystis exedens]|nr:KamA family radical SAM protein [Nannocystis exedens]